MEMDLLDGQIAAQFKAPSIIIVTVVEPGRAHDRAAFHLRIHRRADQSPMGKRPVCPGGDAVLLLCHHSNVAQSCNPVDFTDVNLH